MSLLREECPKAGIGTLTGLFGYSRQSFYNGVKEDEFAENALKPLIVEKAKDYRRDNPGLEWMASHREIIPDYSALGPLCVNKIGPEMQRLGCKCPPPGYCFTIEHHQEYRSTDLDIEYCEQVEEYHVRIFKVRDNLQSPQFFHHGRTAFVRCAKLLDDTRNSHGSTTQSFGLM